MIENLWNLFSADTETERQIRELSAMDDRALADFGISRDQIEEFAQRHSGKRHAASV